MLSVIIVSWNTCDILKACLESHFAAVKKWQKPVETWVVDNGSSDGSLAMLRAFSQREPSLHIIENRDNPGFACACNQGLAKAMGTHLLLLNPDTVVFENTYEKTLAYSQSHPEIGVIGVRTLNPDRTVQPSVWPCPTLWRLAGEAFFLNRLLPKKLRGRILLSGYFDYTSSCEVGYVQGSFVWITRACYEKNGGLWSEMFLFGEDLEYGLRVRQSGMKVVFYPEAEFIHLGNQSTGQNPPQWRVERTVQSLYHALSRFHGRVWLAAYALLECCNFWLRGFLRRGARSNSGYVSSDPQVYLQQHALIFRRLLRGEAP